jgi:hypothetical protein
MSFQAMAWAVKQKVGNATGKAILLMLANYADERGQCFPSQETLATECECSKRSVLDWLQKFEDMGILTRERRHGAGGYRRADILTLSLGAAFSPENNSRENPSKPKCSTFTAEPITEPINPSSLRSEGKREPSQFDELAKVLDTDHANAVIAHRKNFKSKFSPYAARLLAKEFAKCADPNLAAETMIRNGWQGFEAEWMQRQQSRGSPPRTSTSALADSAARLAQTMRTADEIRSGSSGSGVRAAIPHLPVR